MLGHPHRSAPCAGRRSIVEHPTALVLALLLVGIVSRL